MKGQMMPNITPTGPIDIQNTDNLTLYLYEADDELDVYVNGNLITALAIHQPPILLDLKILLSIGAPSILRLIGIDRQPKYASVAYKAVLNGETIISIFSSSGPNDHPRGQWFDESYEFSRHA
jgi:hypothetical protein